MNRKLINGLLLLTCCLLISQISMAQPPPPHPGGSGNQGAVIPLLGMGMMVLAAAGITFKRKG